MDRKELLGQIVKRQSFLCIGLDSQLEKIPKHLLHEEDPIFAFNRQIIDATRDLCVAYKPNTAFYEAMGQNGWESLRKTIAYIGKEHLVIADAKRGDIGNTSLMYARAFFEVMAADAITISPYMGRDTVMPFLQYDSKWVVILGLTSNKSSADFQFEITGGKKIFELVLEKAATWGSPEQIMFVIGATQSAFLQNVRQIIPHHFLLIPGIGAQGGDLRETAKYTLNDQCGILVNSSRSIIFSSASKDFADAAYQAASSLQIEMADILKERKLL